MESLLLLSGLEALTWGSCVFCTHDDYTNGSEHMTWDWFIFISAVEGCKTSVV